MRLLITGGCGFIGSNFIRHILKKHKDIHVINFDKLTYCGNLENLKDVARDPRYKFVKGDICEAGPVGDLARDADVIINFAAESHVDRSIKYPDDFFMTNIYGVKTLLEAARRKGCEKFIQISSDEVYGSVPSGLSKEDDILRPRSPYSASKAAGDLLALSYHTTYGLPVMVTRSSNNFGPYQYPEKVIPLFIANLIQGKKVPLYGDGGNVRDWLFVEDNCAALDMILREGTPGEVYNIGGSNQISNLELTRQILSTMGNDVSSIEHVNDRPGHDRRYALDSRKMQKIGWAPDAEFQENLKKTIKWYKENEDWWVPLREKAEIIEW
ncbi:MAG: dTDP-glucose 4,6-dehydratase [Candidatus Omnitrophica bacterium]|nr:dTDP-glucose 4,6-dehydratase [Candidatus Omnitrophota bacterium]MBU1127992.1 dTDP-glucose 4,6-dehydratase [Candidatus Omnitrophota bacterium]MBU1656611.1 dTDP-glucose 4,6-dehydratase [Candidatus Omnitrophota bacterium]MBU1783856.1 dTDP-glucose 4,6-dehydratase [Candidatus Omnitrophota bacterium]MBU1851500.1 dTDP-glucose 4,6-dehydratase [Candidatus Omnitrophota bacterium]